MKYKKIDKQLFIENRKKLIKFNGFSLLGFLEDENAIAIFNSNDIMPTNADGTMPFRQNSDLFWLSGVDQEESVFVIFPTHPDEKMREVLFLKETNKQIAIWEGAKLNKE